MSGFERRLPEDRTSWFVQHMYTLMALVLTVIALCVQLAHQKTIPAEIWAKPLVAFLECFQIGDQVFSFLVLVTILVFGIKGERALWPILVCAFLSAVSVYSEIHLLSWEYPSPRDYPIGTSLALLGTMGLAAGCEFMSAVLDCTINATNG